MDGCLACYVLAQARLDDAAHQHVIDLLRLYARAAQRFFDDDGSQLFCRHTSQRAAHFADCRTHSAGQYNFFGHFRFLRFLITLKGCTLVKK